MPVKHTSNVFGMDKDPHLKHYIMIHTWEGSLIPWFQSLSYGVGHVPPDLSGVHCYYSWILPVNRTKSERFIVKQ